MATYIHIKAESPYFTIFEIICQSKAVKRPEAIRNNFQWYNNNYSFSVKHPYAKLKVTTGVVNPEIPFKW
jgi:hypothetical protein